MLWLIGIASVWSFFALLAVGLCAMARRGDDALHAAHERTVAELPAEVTWVATISEPATDPVEAPAARPARVRV